MMAKQSSSSSSSSSNDSIQLKTLQKLKEPHLSGAYIRSLVKQITSAATRTKHLSAENGRQQDPTRNTTILSDDLNKNPPPHKKRARRRTQTSKPYQEKLLNMAEARREIVAALKLHRKAREKNSGSESSIRVLSSISENNIACSPGFYSSYTDFAVLPTQTLGLNLNLQDFDKTAVFRYSAASPSPIYSPSPPQSAADTAAEVAGFGGSLELMPQAVDFVDSPFDEVMEFPGWMSADESVNDFFPDAYFQDRSLPCMEIEEIGGIDDGDWLA